MQSYRILSTRNAMSIHLVRNCLVQLYRLHAPFRSTIIWRSQFRLLLKPVPWKGVLAIRRLYIVRSKYCVPQGSVKRHLNQFSVDKLPDSIGIRTALVPTVSSTTLRDSAAAYGWNMILALGSINPVTCCLLPTLDSTKSKNLVPSPLF
jgi:hypothetical protein